MKSVNNSSDRRIKDSVMPGDMTDRRKPQPKARQDVAPEGASRPLATPVGDNQSGGKIGSGNRASGHEANDPVEIRRRSEP